MPCRDPLHFVLLRMTKNNKFFLAFFASFAAKNYFMVKKSNPGVSRQQRISDEGLARLEKQLNLGININAMVLKQWIKRYQSDAVDLLKKYGYELND